MLYGKFWSRGASFCRRFAVKYVEFWEVLQVPERKPRAVRVSDELWEEFQKVCEKKNISSSQAIRNLVRKSVAGEISVSEESEKLLIRLKKAIFRS